jgi:hypothetical protein
MHFLAAHIVHLSAMAKENVRLEVFAAGKTKSMLNFSINFILGQ